ncbi:MAG: DMT family transporter [Pseudomonadota bacterium]
MDFRSLALGLTFVIIWSSAFSAARIIVAEAPPLTISALRFAIAGAILVAIAWAQGQRIRLDRTGWRATVTFGVCQNALYLGLFFVAMQTVEASLATIMASTMPLIVGFASATLMGERIGTRGWAGLIAGFAGVLIIMSNRITGGVDPFGLALCIVGVTALAVATLSVRGASAGGNMLMVVGLQMWVGSAALIPFALWFEVPSIPWSPRLLAAFTYTLTMPGIVATVIWFALVGRIGATRAATYHFLNPFFGVAIASVVLGETLTVWDGVGVAVVMVGILAVQLSRAGAVKAETGARPETNVRPRPGRPGS